MDWITIIIGTVLVNNYVLVKFLGLCPFMGTSKQPEAAFGMGLATSFVLTLTSALSYTLYQELLVPFGFEYLHIIISIIVIATIVGFCEHAMHKFSPMLYQRLGIYLPLITSNCAVLGVALLTIRTAETVLQAALYGFSASIGFTLVLTLFASLRKRIEAADVPHAFQGTPIALITAGIMAIGFMGFAGIV